MNLIDATVTEVLSNPRKVYTKWFVKTKVDSWGRESYADLMFDTEEEAKALEVGRVVLI